MNERTHCMALAYECFGEVTADETAGSGNKDGTWHRVEDSGGQLAVTSQSSLGRITPRIFA